MVAITHGDFARAESPCAALSNALAASLFLQGGYGQLCGTIYDQLLRKPGFPEQCQGALGDGERRQEA